MAEQPIDAAILDLQRGTYIPSGMDASPAQVAEAVVLGYVAPDRLADLPEHQAVTEGVLDDRIRAKAAESGKALTATQLRSERTKILGVTKLVKG